MPVFPADSGAQLSSVSCASASLCVAVGYYTACTADFFCFQTGPAEAITTDPAGGARSWRLANLGGWILNSVSCPTTKLCVAVGEGATQSPSGQLDSVVLASTHPTVGTAWTLAAVDRVNTLDRVSCATATQCVAVDASGNAISSTNPTGGAGAWRLARLTANKLTGISCPAISMCVAVDDAGGASARDRSAADDAHDPCFPDATTV
jgi:hypothetical protein